ncbi:hypothetical protein RDI58_007340 [Solanum bulbocastanum]|uniref:MULE transposase domain-containing protein n=1 Tax=Solanum bulbocastanum TaxID=147425 RepID=A0AAN8YIS8_SOLBU
MRVKGNSYFSNTFNGIGEAIGLIGFGSCEEVDELEELAPGITINPNHSLFEKDQVYKNKYVLTSALKRHSILKHFQFKTRRSSSIRQATKSVVGSIIVGNCAEPDVIYTLKDIQHDMLAEYGVRLTYMQAWRAKEAAFELVRGDPIQSYAKLPSYFHILEATYPSSHIRLHKSEDDRFLYSFVALFTSIKGWEYCRPIVVVDGTFIKGACKGTLLTANTLDVAGSILPLAYAIVDSENDASWRWFFEQFRDSFGQRLEMCIILIGMQALLRQLRESMMKYLILRVCGTYCKT